MALAASAAAASPAPGAAAPERRSVGVATDAAEAQKDEAVRAMAEGALRQLHAARGEIAAWRSVAETTLTELGMHTHVTRITVALASRAATAGPLSACERRAVRAAVALLEPAAGADDGVQKLVLATCPLAAVGVLWSAPGFAAAEAMRALAATDEAECALGAFAQGLHAHAREIGGKPARVVVETVGTERIGAECARLYAATLPPVRICGAPPTDGELLAALVRARLVALVAGGAARAD